MAEESDNCVWMEESGAERIISPPEQRWNMGFISLYDVENNAVRLLSACARKAGYKVTEIYFKDWVNNKFNPPTEREIQNLLSVIEERGLKFVGISVRASAYHKAAAYLTERIRKRFPGILIMWGGTHTVLDPEKCILEADLVCCGEGEIAIVQILDRLSANMPLDGIPSVWVRHGREVVRSRIGKHVQNLDSLPFRDYTSPDKYFIMGRFVRRGDPMVSDSCFQMMPSRKKRSRFSLFVA